MAAAAILDNFEKNYMAISPQRLTIYLYSAHRAVIFAIAQLCCSSYSRCQAIVYCSPAWSGFCSAADINRLDAFLKRSKRYDYCPDDFSNISELFSDADDQLFSRISQNVTHILKPLLPTNTQHSYN